MKITSDYIQAANALRGKRKRDRIVAYVESYDDVLFWRNILSEFENEKRYFEVMLPTRNKLTKGKKQVIMQVLQEGAGPYMVACVDADYDYLMQGATYSSDQMLHSPFVFHTYAYAIENLQCYAPSLHNVCVSATLNDHSVFDFVEYLTRYSMIIHPLFVWNVWLYRQRDFHTFSMSDFNQVVNLPKFTLAHSEQSLERLQHKVYSKLRELSGQFRDRIKEVGMLGEELAALGVKPGETYLFVQGHHLFDNVVGVIVDKVCRLLRNELESDIRAKACHTLQRQNELSAYSNAQTDITQMLKKNTGFMRSDIYRRIAADIQAYMQKNFGA